MTGEAGQVPDAATLGDQMAISDILALHCRGVDRADEAALKVCYWPQATVGYGPEPTPAHEFCAYLAKAIKGFKGTHHVVSNSIFGFQGTAARVETYVTAFHYIASQDGASDTEMTYLGRYIDDFEKRGSVWKMMHREPVVSWTQNMPASHNTDNPAIAALKVSAHYPNDFIYGAE